MRTCFCDRPPATAPGGAHQIPPERCAYSRITASRHRRLYRIPNPESCDLVNAILKRAAATSSIFAQDAEDLATEAWMEGTYRILGQDAPPPVEPAPISPLAAALAVPLHIAFPRQGFNRGDPLLRIVESDHAGAKAYRAMAFLAQDPKMGEAPAGTEMRAVQRAAAFLLEHWAEVQEIYHNGNGHEVRDAAGEKLPY